MFFLRSDDNETFIYSTNNLNQYTSISDEAGNSIGFVYDANGNMIENDTFMFTYDYKNRLIEARLLGDEYMVVTMSYDVLGRRTTKIIDRKSNEGETFMYTYAGAEVLSEHVSYNIGEGRNYTKEYIYGQGIDDVRGLIMTRGDDVRQFWYDKNHLGSVIAITDQEGKIVESYRYDGFGNILIGESKNAIKQTTGPGTKNEQRNVKVDNTGSVGGFSKSWLQNNRLYTSREYDAELNLYYYRGRHYDPRVGRFIQRDPIGYADDTNLYRYVANNPVNFVDPWGLASEQTVEESTMCIRISEYETENITCGGSNTALGTLYEFHGYMGEVNTHGSDKFMHCAASYCGSEENATITESALDFREFSDWVRKGDSEEVQAEDQRANAAGREGQANGESLSEACGVYLTPNELTLYDGTQTNNPEGREEIGEQRSETIGKYLIEEEVFDQTTMEGLYNCE